MRPLIVFSDVTLDGFMAGPDNDLAFAVGDPELDDEFVASLMRVADTIVVGRRSFPEMAAYWTKADGDIAAWMNETPKYVLSTDGTFDVSAWQNTTLVAGDGAAEVRRLKLTAGGSLVAFGGARTVRSLVTADLVDEYWLKLNPVVVGRGGSMFTDLPTTRFLHLRSAKTYPSGTVALTYTTAPDA